ncbi:MAG TPA: hypothetical protein VNT23_06140, partial [Gaiellaceae bacterium]|nr:hypothetical protein [Gaiellaceae bacterium]
MCTNDTAPPQLVQTADEDLVAGVAGVGEDLGSELATDRRGETRQPGRRIGQPCQPCGDNRMDLLGHLASRRRDRLGLAVQRLDEEQWVAFAFVVEALGLALCHRFAQNPLGEQSRLRSVKATEADLAGYAARLERGHELTHGVITVGLLAAGGRRHEQSRLRFRTQQVMDELQGLHVAPLKVVGDQQERRSGRQD